MAKLYFKYGTMKSGKSMHLLMTAHNYESQSKNVLVYTSLTDDRWGIAKVRSRVGTERQAKLVSSEMFNEVATADNISCVLVDEAQFLSREEVIQITRIVDDLNIPVICYGLKNDFQNELFEGSKTLLEYADSIESIKTVCEHPDCGRKATMNLRFHNGAPIYHGEQIMTGDSEYKPVCRKHYNNYMENE